MRRLKVTNMESQLELKIKLVAIAKDEAAYLPEWIFHHLYFGFDAIDIYVNNTTDNTHELSQYLAPLDSVSFIDGDSYFLSGLKTPQQNVYSGAFTKAKEQGFSHIMFLDIDEFWTPLDMSTTIKDCLNLLMADVISFEWLNKFEDNKFSPALESEISGEHHRLVKTLMSLNLNSEKLDIHNIEVEGAINVLADGTKPIFSDGNQQLSKVGEIKPYLIIHRMYRSSLEYVSLLGRGRPRGGGVFKDNRNGFCFLEYEFKTIQLPIDKIKEYNLQKESFLKIYTTNSYFIKAHLFIEKRFNEVLSLIESSSLSEFKVIRKVLRNINLSEVNFSFATYLQEVCKHLSGDVTDNLRNAAVILEKRDLYKSLKMMEVASELRPNGPFIIKKIAQYKKEISRNTD